MGEETHIDDEILHVVIPPHPLIKHWVSVLRDQNTLSSIVRSAMAERGRLLITKLLEIGWSPTTTREIRSPVGVTNGEFINQNEPILIVPILRAGLALSEHASSILPATRTFHLGMARDEKALLPSVYLNKLPDKFEDGARVLVIDPMLATGGTIVAAIDLIKDRGLDDSQIKLISAVSAPPALHKLNKNFPGLQVYTGAIDPILNEKGYIVPGLGDAGDRSFDT